MIIYFSGTGNSRFVAEAIADRLNDEVVSVNKYLKDNLKGSFTSEKPWVFVFPVYLSTIAQPFTKFIRESEFKGNDKAYFVATCASAIGSSPNIAADFCSDKNLKFMGISRVQMPQNYISLFKMTEPDEIKRRQDASLKSADDIAEIVKSSKELDTTLVSKFEKKMTDIVEVLYVRYFTKTKNFKATDACTGCGLCEKQCALNNIKMENGKPKWIKNCSHCMCCINSCPKAAIEIGKGSVGKERYICKKYVPNTKN